MALYDSENNRLLDANDNVLLARATFTVGTREVKKIYVGENEVKAIYIGDNLVYEKEPEIVVPQLDAPTISLDGDTLSISEVENAEYYDIYVDGVLADTIDVRPSFEVAFTITDIQLMDKSYIRIYDGQNTSGTLLFESVGFVATPSPTLTCSSGYLFIDISGSVSSIKNIVTTGGVSVVEGEMGEGDDWLTLKVEANGNCSFSLDWSD